MHGIVGALGGDVEQCGDLRGRLAAIEADLDAGRYRVGDWDAFVRRARQLPSSKRSALAADLDRISRKLHALTQRSTVSTAAGVGLELLGTLVGAIAMVIGYATGSNAAAVAAAAIWMTTFQPLVKLAAGVTLISAALASRRFPTATSASTRL